MDLWAKLLHAGLVGGDTFLTSRSIDQKQVCEKEDDGLGSAAYVIAHLIRMGLDQVLHAEG